MKEILEILNSYQTREETIGERTAFILSKGEKMIRVWWGQKPTPAEIIQVINQVEGAIAWLSRRQPILFTELFRRKSEGEDEVATSSPTCAFNKLKAWCIMN